MRILLCGATGSIAQSFFKLKLDYELVGISYNTNHELAYEIIKKYHLKYFYSPNNNQSTCKSIQELIDLSKPDLIINAVCSMQGLDYTILSIKNKINLCLANKESLVVAGNFIKELAKQNNVIITPIDSEHTSLQELILKNDIKQIKKLYITCSGGRYYLKDKKLWNEITYLQAIDHPNWKMGSKISLDSATLMNKCFEIVEAYHLFNTKQIEALYHPQSIIHSLIEFNDHSVFANMSQPDMQLSIELALNNFKKSSFNPIKPLDFKNLNLTLQTIDQNEWKPIKWAYDIIEDKTNSLGLIINFANERAIELFKNNQIHFDQIYEVIETYIKHYKNININNLDELYMLWKRLSDECIW